MSDSAVLIENNPIPDTIPQEEISKEEVQISQNESNQKIELPQENSSESPKGTKITLPINLFRGKSQDRR